MRYGREWLIKEQAAGRPGELLFFWGHTPSKDGAVTAPRDRIWGIGMGQDNPAAKEARTWRGENLLGFALMEVRDQIRNL